MVNFGKKNHAKIFERINGRVEIWSSIAEDVEEYKRMTGKNNDVKAMSGTISEDEWQVRREIKRAQQKLLRWAKNQNQINTTILNSFLALRCRGHTSIVPADIQKEYAKKKPADTFEKNFNQMVNFGERNHAKVFERINGRVEIWSPIAEDVEEYKRMTGKNNDVKATSGAISEDEWQVRRDLAACYRLFVRYGWTDLIFTHLSARVPGHPEQYLINPYGLLFDEITASNLLKVDFDGNVIAGDYPYNDAGHAIHVAILRARPEAGAVLHSHTRAGMAVSCMECGLLPLTQQANEVRELVCHHDYDVPTDNEAECRRLGEDIGDKWLMILRNHGLLSAGRTVAEAFYLLYTLENACKVQVDVLASGAEMVIPPAEVLAGVSDYARPPADAPGDFVTRSWAALIRMLERQDPSYRE